MTAGTTWTLIASGDRAKIIRNLASHSTPKVQIISGYQLAHNRQPSAMADRSPALGSRHRMGVQPHSDPVRNRERLFIEQLAEYLIDRHSRGEFDSLLVLASPRTLGDVIKVFPDALRQTIVGQSDIDLTELADTDLINTLRGMFGSQSS